MRTRNERGALSNRGIGFGLASLALTACAFGLPGHGGGGTTAPTTTLPATTTTVAATTTKAATTTTTGVPPTTSPGNPCAAENLTTTGFPCTATAGVHGVTFTAANTTAHNATTCTACPPGLTWSSSTGYRISSCGVTIDAWKITDDVDVRASNGTHPIYGTESAAIAGACVKLTHVLIVPPSPGSDGEVGLSTGFWNYGTPCGAQSPCGPVYMSDSEISMPQAPTSFSYAATDANLHFWRVYLHGTSQGIDSQGASEVHNSVLRADRSEAAMTGAAHGDGYFQNSNPGGGLWMLVDHNSIFCGALEIDCARGGAFFGDEAAPHGGVVQSNLFKKSNAYYCISTGADDTGANNPKAFPVGNNITIKNNVFEKNSGPSSCGGTAPQHPFPQGGAITNDWSASVAAANNDHWCNNRLDDGQLAYPDIETGGCP